MTKRDYEKLRRVGLKVREFLEKLAKQQGRYYDGIGTPNKGRGCSRGLNGYCGLGAYLLFKKLKASSFKPTFVYGDQHCFVTVNNQYVMDVTATQFERTSRVVIRPISKIGKKFYWKCGDFTTLRKIGIGDKVIAVEASTRLLTKEKDIKHALRPSFWREQSPFHSTVSKDVTNFLRSS